MFRSTLLHLRIPFSYFLLPIYLFALSQSPDFTANRLLWSFLLIHFFLYPASNGYNSYFDRDEQSIGGLKNPPKVNISLYWASLGLDGIALVLAAVNVSTLFAVLLFIYGLASKAYSHPSIRLKKYPFGGWFVTGFFQGFFTFLMSYVGINQADIGNLFQIKTLVPAALTSLMLWGNYPMTQVYQHEEDTQHGDRTLSLWLGIRGTFIFVQVVFGLAAAGFVWFFLNYYTLDLAIGFIAALAPVVLYFMYWFLLVWKNPAKADYAHTMWLNFISATCLNLYFVYFFLANSHYGGYF
ncbi:MAG: UbiA family prenyltransferase [Flammeovirgaceae bacterium]